jgi:hypothetical protein
MLKMSDELAKVNKSIRNSVRRLDIRFLSVNADPKTIKGFKSGKGFLTGILYLAPYNASGHNVCPHASPDCIKACLHTAGVPYHQGNKNRSRINKTKWFFGDSDVTVYNDTDIPTREGFLNRLKREILALKGIAAEHGLRLAIRLNGTSDIAWECFLADFISENSDIDFYDYTKNYNRAIQKNNLIHLTFSRSEINQDETLKVLAAGGNVAVVFDKVPETWRGYQVIEGDEDDLRFLNGQSQIIGLKAKGEAVRQYKADAACGFGREDKFVVRISQ